MGPIRNRRRSQRIQRKSMHCRHLPKLAASVGDKIDNIPERSYSRPIESRETESTMDHLSEAFDAVAAYFSVLSEPTRLRIMHCICETEKTVSQIVEETGATQTNVSRHLGMMHRSRVLTRRKEGNQVYYRAADAAMVELCRGVCKRISEQMDEKIPLHKDLLRLLPPPKHKSKSRAA